jgi:LysW-gamma-L-alpha-aminoadipyl-6-phosphate/LysW-L-glutamyl-5-phosphate reductase
MKGKVRASIMGGSGYAAAELVKRLVNHPNSELVRISSIDYVGENIGAVHRSFADRLPYTLEDLSPEEVARDCDVVFLCLPHKVSYLMAPKLFSLGVKVIDFSGDYRIRDHRVYEKYYNTTHTNPENIESFTYGLPELNAEEIKSANRVANPGCFPTATALSLLPLAQAGLLNGKVRVVGPTGSSGSGVHPQAGTHHPVRHKNIKSYKPLTHQHQPEMLQVLADAGGRELAVDFIPISAPLSRGILTNAIVDLPADTRSEDIYKLYQHFYQDKPFVRVLPYGKFPEIITVAGTNHVEIGIQLGKSENGSCTLAAIASIDNLVKGASGQAIQNMNLMFGLDESAGLNDFAMWP